MLELGALIEQDQVEGLTRMGLTSSRAHALWVLGAAGPCSHRALADALRVTPRAVTDLVDALEGQGLVTRQPDPGDRRASVVTPTAEGLEMVARLQREHTEYADTVFGDFTEEQLDTFVASITRVLAVLRPLVSGHQP